jgi:hypothetical protein
MASVVVCAEPSSLQQAGHFAAKLLVDADLRSFEELWREIPIQPVLVYLTHPDYDYLRSLLEFLKPKGGPEVVIYLRIALHLQTLRSLASSWVKPDLLIQAWFSRPRPRLTPFCSLRDLAPARTASRLLALGLGNCVSILG